MALYALNLSLISGCGYNAPKMPSADEIQQDIVSFSEAGGYRSPGQHAVTSIRETWKFNGKSLDITFLSPETSGHYPLIIYLPGLGENAEAGTLWRTTWAKAGYTVATVQLTSETSAVKLLGDEDLFDLHGIGRRHFSKSDLDLRNLATAWAIQELKTRSDMGKAPFNKANFNRMVLAGYDLGAQTVASLAGENDKTSSPKLKSLSISALILISPHVDLAQGGMSSRYQDISAPTLSITGNGDLDPWGITSPSLKTAIFEGAPPTQKYLLLLNNGNHRQLSGSDPSDQQEGLPWEKREGDEIDREANEGSETSETSNNAASSGGGNQNQVRGGPDDQGRGQPGGFRKGRANKANPKHYGQELAAIQSITTAFLDTEIKSESNAQSWLNQHASEWIHKIGALHRR